MCPAFVLSTRWIIQPADHHRPLPQTAAKQKRLIARLNRAFDAADEHFRSVRQIVQKNAERAFNQFIPVSVAPTVRRDVAGGRIWVNHSAFVDVVPLATGTPPWEFVARTGARNHQAIPWIASIGGVSQWTYLIAIFAKSMHHYNEIMMQIKEICQDKLKDYEMLWLIDEYFFGQRYLFTSGKKETDFSYREYRIPLEEKAYSYIHNEEYKMLLRISEFEQYYQLNFSSEFELDVKRLADIVYDLKSKDIIIGLMPVCDIRALGLEWYIILLRLKKLSKKEKDNFMKFMSNYLQIFHIIFCTGKWEVKIELHVKDQEQFDDIFSSIRTNFDDIIYGEPYYFKILAEFKLNYLVKSVFVDWRMNE